MVRVVVGVLGAASMGVAMVALTGASEPDPVPQVPPPWDITAPTPWSPPQWFPEQHREQLWVLDHLDGPATFERGPRVQTHAAIIADLDSGEVLWARDPDGPRGIASVTKLFSSLALSSYQPDLEREICVGYEHWPSRPGARSKFETGDCHFGWELVGAALVASDNRGAFAFPSVASQDYFHFIDRMHHVAEDLGAGHVEFGDPAGLEDDNRASPRAVLKAVIAVSAHPTLASVASAPTWFIEPERGNRRLYTTNRLLAAHHDEFDTLAAKTGYTDTAKYCFATVVRSRKTGRRFAAVVLAAPTGRSRWSDVLSLLRWADSA